MAHAAYGVYDAIEDDEGCDGSTARVAGWEVETFLKIT
jgi:hypothetical protein